MSHDDMLIALRDLVQEDVGNRGLRTDPSDNLVTAFPGDFAAACHSLAAAPRPRLCVVTGFYIPAATPPCGETDGPLGAVFLARALVPLGIEVVLAADGTSVPAMESALEACGLTADVPVIDLPPADGDDPGGYREEFADAAGPLTHLMALERVGPAYGPDDLRARPWATESMIDAFLFEVPSEHHGRCHTMRGRDVTDRVSPAHLLFERPGIPTIGVGDGGNEIGMGKLPWDVVRRNVPQGGRVACRVPTDLLVVCGVSNWGAYALAAGVRLLRGAGPGDGLFDTGREHELLVHMVMDGPLVDGVTAKPTATVDGLDFERYAAPLVRMGEILAR
jgi:hypothetical protein